MHYYFILNIFTSAYNQIFTFLINSPKLCVLDWISARPASVFVHHYIIITSYQAITTAIWTLCPINSLQCCEWHIKTRLHNDKIDSNAVLSGFKKSKLYCLKVLLSLFISWILGYQTLTHFGKLEFKIFRWAKKKIFVKNREYSINSCCHEM